MAANSTQPDAMRGLLVANAAASEVGLQNKLDPLESADKGADYFARQLRKFNGDAVLAILAYRWGPGHAASFRKTGFGYKGAPLPLDVATYINEVTGVTDLYQYCGVKSPR